MGIGLEVAKQCAAEGAKAESDGITGKFIAAQWDPWREKPFQDRLRADKDFATIRRIDDKIFFKK